MSSCNATVQVPVLLLKTKSTPADSYEEVLSGKHGAHTLAPRFVPVLLHRFEEEGLAKLRSLLQGRRIGGDRGCDFGGLIFTSQRAVEAFTKVVEDGKGDSAWPHLQNVPVYSVGPATTRALKAVSQKPNLQVFGEHTGNGEALAQFILQHYGQWYHDKPTKPPLLFLVGEQRRDIIAKTLMDPSLPAESCIEVTEEVVYGTGVMESFPVEFDQILRETADSHSRWVVVFSPTGCDSLLRGLGMLDSGVGKVDLSKRDGKTFVATIGPTTRTFLINTFGFEPDVCADTPSPEGILQGIADYEAKTQRGTPRGG